MGKKTQNKETAQTVGGDLIGRDHQTTISIGGSVSGSNIVVGNNNIVGEVAQGSSLFLPVYDAISRSARSSQDKADLTAEVQEIEAAIAQPQVDESWLARRLRNLKKMAPDIAEIVLAALSGPGAVISTTVKKIAERAQAE